MKIFVFGGKNKNSQTVTTLQLFKIRQSVSAALPYSHPIISKKKKKNQACVLLFSGRKKYAIFSAYELLLLESNQLLIV